MDVQRPLTVVQILSRFDDGGGAQAALEIGAALVRRGHRAVVISPPGRLVPYLAAKGVEHIAWPLPGKVPFTWRWGGRLRKLLVQQGADVLHAWSPLPSSIACHAWRSMDPRDRPRLVTTAHDFHPVKRRNRALTCGERVIAVSDAVKQYLLDHYPDAAPEKIEVIYRGIDERAFPYGYKPDIHWLQQWYRQYPQLIDRYVVTLPGRLARDKGHYDFMELLSRLRDRSINACGLIVGDEDPPGNKYGKLLRRYVMDKQMDNVLLTGHRRDIRNILSVSNLVVALSSRPEAVGRTVLKSLQLGVPVVGYDHGVVGEVLGKVFPEGRTPALDMEKLVDRVADVLMRPRHVEETTQFRLSRMLDDTIGLYQRLYQTGLAEA